MWSTTQDHHQSSPCLHVVLVTDCERLLRAFLKSTSIMLSVCIRLAPNLLDLLHVYPNSGQAAASREQTAPLAGGTLNGLRRRRLRLQAVRRAAGGLQRGAMRRGRLTVVRVLVGAVASKCRPGAELQQKLKHAR